MNLKYMKVDEEKTSTQKLYISHKNLLLEKDNKVF